ncbi:MAG: response regulator [Candidatus Firestonebacteria bacterium]|nr:response regulator [Candidatus Firestonebacteria bacterium]
MLKAFIIDDEKYILDVLTRILGFINVSVFTASSGCEAMEKMKENDFDFILLDLCLPEKKSLEWECCLKKIYLSKPIIIMSGYSEGQLPFEMNPFAYLTKPFGLKDVLQLVTEIEKKYSFNRNNLPIRVNKCMDALH